MDWRISDDDYAKLCAQLGIDRHDTISVAGAGKDLVSSQPGESDFLLKQIGIARDKHGINEIIILFHDDCGAYGIADLAAEEAAQRADADKIRSLLAVKFPALLLRCYLIKDTPTGQFTVDQF